MDEIVAWLTGVLDVLERGQDGPMDYTWMARRDSDKARAQAERLLLAEYVEHRDTLTPDAKTAMEGVLRVIAWGHRHDASGAQIAWAPNVTAAELTAWVNGDKPTP